MFWNKWVSSSLDYDKKQEEEETVLCAGCVGVCVPSLNLFLRENDSEISVHKSKFQNHFSLV